MIEIILLTKIMISLFCILITLCSGDLLRFLKEISDKLPKLVLTLISILCILGICNSAAMSFTFFIIWDVSNSIILYQTLIFLICTCILLYIFNKMKKNNIMIFLMLIWCLSMTYYFVYLFNHYFLLV